MHTDTQTHRHTHTERETHTHLNPFHNLNRFLQSENKALPVHCIARTSDTITHSIIPNKAVPDNWASHQDTHQWMVMSRTHGWLHVPCVWCAVCVVCVCVCVCVHMCIRTYVDALVCTCVCIHVCMYVFLQIVCTPVCKYTMYTRQDWVDHTHFGSLRLVTTNHSTQTLS